MIFGYNKRKINEEAFYVDNDPIEIIHEYKYLGIDFYSHGYFKPFSKRQRIERSSSRNHLLGTQIPSIQGFGASNFHIWH